MLLSGAGAAFFCSAGSWPWWAAPPGSNLDGNSLNKNLLWGLVIFEPCLSCHRGGGRGWEKGDMVTVGGARMLLLGALSRRRARCHSSWSCGDPSRLRHRLRPLQAFMPGPSAHAQQALASLSKVASSPVTSKLVAQSLIFISLAMCVFSFSFAALFVKCSASVDYQ